ncbi:threonylcarbamoyl-AMP synthase [bacterium BMS3Abin05]|nr:threonylcarbamoyl-AMP synthase [bacterium BMS3Abin05]HDZ11838.1 threonylcarbamoyl-AMP synthase [Bacteroidota bacterium]
MRNQNTIDLQTSELPLEILAEKTAAVLKQGGVIIYPTDTIYGLGADPFRMEAVDRVYALKGRSFQKPCSVLIGSVDMLQEIVETVTPAAKDLMRVFWPGSLTLVFRVKHFVQGRFLAKNRTLGVRLPDHPFSRQVSAALGSPILSTSANRSGGQNPLFIADIPAEIRHGVDLIVDEGPSRLTKPSTILNVSGDRPLLIREGTISRAAIEKIVGKIQHL